MTMDEAVQAANAGDVSAMLAIARSYVSKDDPTSADLDAALPWFEKAAETGSIHGTYWAMQIREIKADMMYELGNRVEGAYAAGVQNYLAVANLAHQVLMADDCSDEMDQKATKAREHACFQIGIFQYFSDEISEAIKWFGMAAAHSDPMSKVALGTCTYFDTSASHTTSENVEVTLEAYKKAYSELSIIEGSLRTLIEQGKQSENEAIILGQGILALSSFYRQGMCVTKDIDKAHQLLAEACNICAALNVPASNSMYCMLAEDLKRYQKKLFGGYQYS